MRILIADDDPVQRGLLETMVRRFGYEAVAVESGEAIFACLSSTKFDLLILDMVMPDLDGMAVIERLRGQNNLMPIIIQTSATSIDATGSAIKVGASDFVVKPVGAERLHLSIRNALQRRAIEDEMRKLSRKNADLFDFDDLVAGSAEMQRVWRRAKHAAASALPVLLEGEEGTGKQAIARAIHGAGDRRGKPFIVVDCAHLTNENAEAVLFGSNRPPRKALGKLAASHGGTLFLDHVDRLPVYVQSSLLQAVQDSENTIARGRHSRRSNIRIISASGKNLLSLVKAGSFREDLYYRLHVLSITLPPLRMRREDIADLALVFLARFAAEEGRNIRSISTEALTLLKNYEWPGNVRQLEAAVFRAVTLAESDALSVSEFPQIAAVVQGFNVDVPAAPSGILLQGNTMGSVSPKTNIQSFHSLHTVPLLASNGDLRTLDAIEADTLRFAIRHCRGQMSDVARRLGIGRSTLYRRLKDLGLPGISETTCDLEDTQVGEIAA